ncbi:glycosyltransferase family 4 protein [Halobellus limi]|uniref:Glycosyltransferase family 1 protein n=1 Tax=Halobellus limi TaxID=699433 RepID=A0A1H5TYC0_9EURY|nr:glycosyltransferase [Halobellus limi]QCC47201.1 glycosyltransferase family 1 protein [Halobellus limi]SEF67783.1 Glycosyltransferase involved in cell wall bisynthesis [Halobellus limi]
MDVELNVGWVYPAMGHSVNEESANYGHPAHRGFQQHIDADPILLPDVDIGPFAGTFAKPLVEAWQLAIPEYDVYILENAEAVYAAPFIRRAYPDATIILLAAHRVFGLESYDFASDPFPKSVFRRGERYLDQRLIRRFIRSYVDGVLAVSDLVKSTVEQFAPGLPVEVVYPYVQPDMVEALDGVTPNLGSNHAVTVCEGRDHKGVDLLVEAWSQVREQIPDATLHIVGSGHPEKYESTPGVTVRGFVDDLGDEYGKASLYVHPARADAFGVTVTEAMRAGVVPLVTRTTGAYPIVREVSPDMVVELNVESLADGVIRYFEQSDNVRQQWSKQAIKGSKPFVEDKMIRKFKNWLRTLLEKDNYRIQFKNLPKQ